MLRKLQYVTFIACLAACSAYAAGANSIGTASVRGPMLVDSYTVLGNATLFDGTMLETSRATADLRMSGGVNVMLATDSRTTVFLDHMVLDRGKARVFGSGAYAVDVQRVHVTASQPNSSAMVAVLSGNTVEVEALAGEFTVTSDHGALLATVTPGKALAFSAAQSDLPKNNTSGTIAKEGDQYYVTESDGTRLLISPQSPAVKKQLDKLVGKQAEVVGSIQGGAINATYAHAEHNRPAPGAGGNESNGLLIGVGGEILGLGAAIGIGIYAANASR